MTFLGNFPLLFSQIEYVRAVVETAKAKPLQMAAMAPGLALNESAAGAGQRHVVLILVYT